jgi:hypothetical protein
VAKNLPYNSSCSEMLCSSLDLDRSVGTTRNASSLNRTGSLNTAARELVWYRLDVLGVLGV